MKIELYNNKTELKFVLLYQIIFLIVVTFWFVYIIFFEKNPSNDSFMVLFTIIFVFLIINTLYSIIEYYKKLVFSWPLLILKKDGLYDRYSFNNETKICNRAEIDSVVDVHGLRKNYVQLLLKKYNTNLENIYANPIRKYLITYNRQLNSLLIDHHFFSGSHKDLKKSFLKFVK